MATSTSLVTWGYICYGRVEVAASLHLAEITSALEVRPTIRQAAAPPPAPPNLEPVIVSAQDLRPQISGQAEPDPTMTDPPANTSAQELIPKIIKAEEE